MVDIIRRLIVAGLAIGVIAGNSDQVTEFFDRTVENARHLATAADLSSISNMLDYHYMKRGRYPQKKRFKTWMAENFKESPVHTLGLDHWERPLAYEPGQDRKTYVLTSAGPDGFVHTDDDMVITGP